MNIFLIVYTILLSLIFLGLIFISFYRDKDSTIQEADYNPKTLVIVPIKGLDITLKENLLSLKRQNYKNYDIVAVIDSYDDPAVKVIEETGINYILSDSKGKGSGKVKAVATAIERYKNYDAYVIADSDIHVQENWLQELIKPLSIKDVGISTTFPIFIPINGFWSKVKLVWGFVGQRLMESRISRFGWGGSLAFRRDLIDEKFLENFRNCLSDDIEITRRCKRLNLRIYYVEKIFPKVFSKESFKSFMEWSNRQTALTVMAYYKIFAYGFIYYFLSVLLLVSSIILSILVNIFYIIFIIPTLLNSIKTYIKTNKRYPITIFIGLFINFIYLYNLIKAKRTKYINWRGNIYKLEQSNPSLFS